MQKPFDAKPERVEKIILAAIVLHNYLRQTGNACYTPNGFMDSEDNSRNIVPGQWRSILVIILYKRTIVHNNIFQVLLSDQLHSYRVTELI